MKSINLVEELCRLVRIRSEVSVSESGEILRENYEEAARAVADLAGKAGLEAKILNLKYESGSIPTVLVEVNGGGKSIAFVCHYDVVPAKGPWSVGGREFDPYEPVVLEGKVYGRGAADDKSAIVASIAALAELLKEGAKLGYKPCIVVTGDEEVGGYGVRALIKAGYRWDRVVVLDAGADYLSVGASGVIHGWIRVKGRSGHAGYPHRAVNPVEAAARLTVALVESYKPVRCSKISRFNSPPGSPVPKVWGRFSVTILKLPPGEPEKHNRIPSEALIGFDARLLPEENLEDAMNELYSTFSSIVSKLGINAEISAWGQRGWYTSDESFLNEALRAACKACETVGLPPNVKVAAELGGNDGTFFFEAGMPVVAFGAMRADCNVHSENEFVYVRDLELLKEFVKNLVRGGEA